MGSNCDRFKMFEGLYGPYFTPHVDESGNLSWTNNYGLPNPPTINIMGEPGTGLTISGQVDTVGELPASADDWTCYLVGTEVPYTVYTYNPNSGWMSLGQLASGPKGDPGAVYTPSVSAAGVITWTNNGDLPNPEGVNIKGPQGDDGVSPTVTVEDITGGHRVTIYDAEHPEGQSFDVMDGEGGGGSGPSPYTSNPAALGTASPGSSADYARGDHVHPKPSAADIGAGTYSKPSGGIPKSDLASAVQTSLGKADAALPKAGGTMSGAIAMGSNKITGLANGTADGDAVNLGQVSGLISTNTAFFRGSFASKAALLAVAWQTSDPSASYYVTNNDFAIVQDDESQSDECWRYVYVAGTGWEAQYRINETPLTTAQLAALNSGATASNINSIAGKAEATTVPASGTVNSSGQIVISNSGGTQLFTVQLPLYNGGVS